MDEEVSNPLEKIASIPLDSVIVYGMVGAAVVIVLAAAYLLYQRSRGIRDKQDAEAARFERELMASVGVRGSAMPSIAPYPARTVSSGGTAGGETAVGAAAVGAAAPVATEKAGVPSGSGQPSDFANSVIGKLRAANLLLAVDGPVRSRNPELTGTILKLKGNQKVAVLERIIEQDDPDLEMLVNLLDAVIMPGPGAEPLYVKRLQNFIGDQFNVGG